MSRRERGVLAQREYRRRHASKFQALQDENDRLKLAISEVDKVFHAATTRNDRLATAIQHARDAAGLPPPEPGTPLVIIPDTPRAALASEAGIGDEAASKEDFFLGNLSLNFDISTPTDLTNPDWVRDSSTESASAALEYPDGNTFAGCIFWRALAHNLPVFDYENGPDRVTIHRTAAEIDLLMSRWVHPDRLDVIDRLWERRLRFRTKGDRVRQLADRYGLTNPTHDELLQRAREEYKELKERRFWRTSSEMEAILIATLTKEEWARFEDVLAGTGTNKDVEMLLELVESMAQTYYCLGEGPRWNCIWAHMAIGAWVKKLRTSGDDVKIL